MIRNILFDMGNVITVYDSYGAGRHFIKDEALRKKVVTSVFISPEWLMLDMGIIPEEDALKRMKDRLDTEEEKELAETCFNDWHLYNKWPMPHMAELVKELKEKGFKVFMLSNASIRMPKVYKQTIPLWELYDGFLFSAEIQYIKPQKEIYLEAFRRFRIRPEESFFVDDVPANVEGGKRCGMDGYCFADGDILKLKKRLSEVTGTAIV
jgi:putative hydrolase of the HAD superfamily